VSSGAPSLEMGTGSPRRLPATRVCSWSTMWKSGRAGWNEPVSYIRTY